MRLTERRDGTIRIEAIGRIDRYQGREFAIDPDPMTIVIPGGRWVQREIRVGDEGCLRVSHGVSPNAMRSNNPTEYSASLYADADGVPGNSNSNISRLHGWRGTTGDSCCYAMGWRRVESIAPRKRGVGYVVILSADLRPTDA